MIQDNPLKANGRKHMNSHRPYESLCKFCVMGGNANSPYKRSDAQDDLEGVAFASMECGFFSEKESLVIRERRTQHDVGDTGSQKRN